MGLFRDGILMLHCFSLCVVHVNERLVSNVLLMCVYGGYVCVYVLCVMCLSFDARVVRPSLLLI
jgi:hypothetical protein